MQSSRVRAQTFALAVLASAAGFASSAAAAGSNQVFPVSSSLVPLLVAGVFGAPALLACLLSMMRRARRTGPVLGLGLVIAAAAVAMYVRPDLVASLRI